MTQFARGHFDREAAQLGESLDRCPTHPKRQPQGRRRSPNEALIGIARAPAKLVVEVGDE